MSNIGETLFGPLTGEPPEATEARAEANKQVFERALNNQAGRELLRLLYSVSHPMAPRFGHGRTPEEAAFLDGERSLIGLLWLNGTNEKTMSTKEPTKK